MGNDELTTQMSSVFLLQQEKSYFPHGEQRFVKHIKCTVSTAPLRISIKSTFQFWLHNAKSIL